MHQEGELTSYHQFVSYFLAIFETDDIIGKLVVDLMNFKKLGAQSAVEYTQVLWTKTLRCRPVCNEHSLKVTFIEGPIMSTGQSVQNYSAKIDLASL